MKECLKCEAIIPHLKEGLGGGGGGGGLERGFKILNAKYVGRDVKRYLIDSESADISVNCLT